MSVRASSGWWLACVATTALPACLPTLHGPGDAAIDARETGSDVVASDATDATDAPDVLDVTDASDGSDAMDVTDVTDAAGPAVTGTWIARHIVAGGSSVMVPRDLSGVMIEALVYSGGSWQHFAGTGAMDGTFRIPGVPLGEYVLHVGQTFVFTQQRAVDMGGVFYGRPDATQVGADPTNVVFTLGGMYPWADGDMLEAFAPNASAWAFSLETTAMNPPGLGDTMLNAFTVNWFNQGLVLGTRNDRLSLMQLSVRPPLADGTVITSARRIYNAPAFDMVPGQDTPFTDTFSDISQSLTFFVDWRRSSFENFRLSVNPTATTVAQLVSIEGLAGGFANGRSGPTADLLDITPGDLTGSDMNLGGIAYGNPFPTSYGLVASVYQTFRVRYMLPGESASNAQAQMFYSDDPSVLSAGPITAQLSPVRNPTVNGMDAFTALSSLGATPTIAWTPPVVGIPDYYIVNVYRIAGGASARTLLATIYTTSTSMVLPPFIAAPGDSITLTISDVWEPGVDITQTPGILYHLPEAQAQVLSAILQL